MEEDQKEGRSMKTLSSRILVEVDMQQKDMHDGLIAAREFQGNYRERRPVLCTVIQGNEMVKRGLKLLVHHNFFYDNSPYRVVNNTYAINTNEHIFARLLIRCLGILSLNAYR
jgi:hypothetical protein